LVFPGEINSRLFFTGIFFQLLELLHQLLRLIANLAHALGEGRNLAAGSRRSRGLS
jgi:hypothetical protein